MPSQPRRAPGKNEGDNSDNGPEAECEDQKPNANDRISVIKAAFHGLYSDGWTQNSIVTVVAFLVSPFLTYMLLQSPKGMLYGFGIGATIALWGLIFAVAKHIDSPKPRTDTIAMSDPTPPHIINITSANQSGNAMTAHTINLGDPHLSARVDKIDAKIDQRTITNAQEALFIAALKDAPRGPVEVWQFESNAECKTFARQVESLLKTAGFTVRPRMDNLISLGFSPNGLELGILDANAVPKHAKALQVAFSALGIPAPGRGWGECQDKDVICILIGAKP